MDYQETINYLYTRLPMFSRIGAAAIKPNLNNTLLLCESLGNPQQKFKAVHIAGTNGKGSTSHMLASVLQTAGYKTGLYTSPHLKDFRERIRVNGKFIDKDYLVGFVERIIPQIEKIEPSFFEITVAMAFDYFAKEQVDIAVIETGLGGRLDSTNVVNPILSVVTNIGWDHMNILGDSLEKIASEKAGIIKYSVPVVIGEYQKETAPVFEEKSKITHSPISFANHQFFVTEWKYENHLLKVTVGNKSNDERHTYSLDLPGYYQTKNLLTVLEAIHQLQQLGLNISFQQVKDGLAIAKKQTGLHGRWELIHTKPDIILDVAHNEDGIKQVLAQLELTNHHDLHIIIGMVKDKEIGKVLQLLPREANYYFTKAQIPRALPQNELMNMASSVGLKGHSYENVQLALKAAKAAAKSNDLILVCGSVFLVGEVE